MPKVIKVIESQINRGKGTKDSPIRLITQYHTLEGNFLAEHDPQLHLQDEEISKQSDEEFIDELLK